MFRDVPESSVFSVPGFIDGPQNVHKLFMLVRKLLFLSQLTTKNSLLQTLHGGKMNRKKR